MLALLVGSGLAVLGLLFVLLPLMRGADYISSHTCLVLREVGLETVVLNNLYNGANL